jgi:glucosylceramidase
MNADERREADTMDSFAPAAHESAGPAVDVTMSSEDGILRMTAAPALRFTALEPGGAPVVEVDLGWRGQSILGLGASFDHATCENLGRLPSDRRAEVVERLVSPTAGIGMNLMRVCIGTSDFASLPYYTYDDMPPGMTDPDLARFSIEADRAHVLPVIKLARSINPDMLLFASPWSPPAWMKSTSSLGGGVLRRRWYDAYARYLLAFLRAYEAEGLPIHALTLQNEPRMVDPGYPTTRWSGDEQRDFIRDHLGPLFEREGVTTRIWCWDHNWNNLAFPTTVLSDPGAARHVEGTAFHLYEGRVEAQTTFHEAFPDRPIYFTEGSVYGALGGLEIIRILRNWSRSYSAWVVMLDEHQQPNSGPHDADPTPVELLDDGTVRYNADYFIYGQFMQAIARDAVRVGSSDPGIRSFGTVAVVNPDGEVVLVAANSRRYRQRFAVRCDGLAFEAELPPRTVATYRWRPAAR